MPVGFVVAAVIEIVTAPLKHPGPLSIIVKRRQMVKPFDEYFRRADTDLGIGTPNKCS